MAPSSILPGVRLKGPLMADKPVFHFLGVHNALVGSAQSQLCFSDAASQRR